MPNWTKLDGLDLDNFIKKFAQVCQDLAILADEIDESSWAKNFFRPAYLTLSDDRLTAKQKLDTAIYQTRVFGGMGSWLDCPPHNAHLYQKDECYETLTRELFVLRQQAIELSGNIKS